MRCAILGKSLGAALLLGLLGLGGTTTAEAETDSGHAERYPWSGYWWQHRSGGLTKPLQKYDRATRSQAAGWESEVHASPSAPDWFGHCHAWAASSILEREPKTPRAYRQIAFGVGDQKGLLAACHAQDVANSYGERFDAGDDPAEKADLSPDRLWWLLQLYVKRHRLPVVLDLEAGEEVWNYPVYQYRVDYRDAGDGWYSGSMELVVADNNVRADFVGTQYQLHNYTFRMRMQDGAIVAGSGEWTGRSVQDHPDFGWYPYVAVAENPHVEVDQVAPILGYPVGGARDAPPDNEGPIETDPPQPPGGTGPSTPPESPNGGTDEPPDEPAPPIDTDGLLGPYQLLDLLLNKTSWFDLDVFTDRGDGGRYQPGEPIHLSVRSGESGYLYIFDVDPKGQVRLVFPQAGRPNHIEADTLYDLPAMTAVQAPRSPGQHELKAVVVHRQIGISGFQQNLQQHPQTPRQQQSRSDGSGGSDATPERQSGSRFESEVLTVHPTARRQISSRLVQRHAKGTDQTAPEQTGADQTGGDEKVPPPKKLGKFAQDSCLYFVLNEVTSEQEQKPGKSRRRQQTQQKKSRPKSPR